MERHAASASNGKATPNPFMTTSSQSYGLSMVALQEVASSSAKKEASKQAASNSQKGGNGGIGNNGNVSSGWYDLSFLYSRESDRIGEGIESSDSALAAVMAMKPSKATTAARRRNESTTTAKETDENSKDPLSKEDIERTLASYNHNPKEEEPLYTTSANEYGRKKPSHATYLAESRARSQKFSNSFHGVMYSNEGLRQCFKNGP